MRSSSSLFMAALFKVALFMAALSTVALSTAACGGAQTTRSGPDTSDSTHSTANQSEDAQPRITGFPSDSLIPRTVFFGDPDRALARISPDGTRVSYLAPSEGVLNVWVAPVGDLSQATVVTQDRTRPVRRYFWAYTNQHIIYAQDVGGDEDWHVYSVDLKTGESLDLTPLDKVQARIMKVSHKHPGTVVIGLNDRDPRHHDLYKVDIATGQRTLLQQNDGFIAFTIDDDYNVRLAARMTDDGSQEVLKPAKGGEWKLLMTIPHQDAMTTSVLDVDNKTAYLFDSRDRNTSALYSLDLGKLKRKLLAEHDKADASSVLQHPTRNTIQAVSFNHTRREWKILDASIKPDFKSLAELDRGEFMVVDRTLNDRVWVVAFFGDDRPVKYYLWDRKAKKSQFLFTDRNDLEGLELSPMHPVVIQSRDGLELVSYLSLPVSSDTNGDARPDSPLPMVLLVHGGPWGRDVWGYNPLHQLLANRGYAVLSVNFRGSTGFGKAFVNAADGKWGLEMHDDLLDAVSWATAQGVAREGKVCIMGGSYGGYATLAGLTFTPETFACGVDIVGPSNLITLLKAIPPYWAPMISMFKTRVGDWTTAEGEALLTDRSPLTHAGKIKRPLLIGQGANDPRVAQRESDQLVEAMQKNDIPVTYVLFPDEGHGFARPANKLAFFAIAEAFLSAHLGGFYQPMSAEDFKGSSITIPVGAEGVPGLPRGVGRN
jgi:dipeptidyl aminopeptidase/acylaminoacyl peptidase